MQRRTAVLTLAFAVIVLGWVICAAAQFEKYLGVVHGLAVTCLGAALVGGALVWLRRALRRGVKAPWATWCALALLILAFATIYPKAQRHAPGGGSDREDALRVEAQAFTHHQYPYDARTFLGNPPTPLPGAMDLALPFYAVGSIALQNLVWITLFALFLRRYFRAGATAALYLCVFLLLALENLNDFAVGGDYVVNALYVAVAVALMAKAAHHRLTNWQTVAAVVLYGLALSSRPVYAVTLPALLCYGIRHGAVRRMLALLSVAVAVSVAVTLPVFLPHPVAHLAAQFAQNSAKVSLPRFLPAWLLFAISLAVACAGLAMRRLDLPRTFGLTGAALLVLILPPMLAIQRYHGGWTGLLTTDLEYFAAPALFLGLWAFAAWERSALATSATGPSDRRTGQDRSLAVP